MDKVIFPDSFDFGMPIASLVDIHSRGVDSQWMQKRAAVLTEDIANMQKEAGKSHIHLIAMGAYHRYGNNRNGDAFSKSAAEYKTEKPCQCGACKQNNVDTETIKIAAGLLEQHPTFVEFGNVYKHHQNHDPDKRSGEIKASAYNNNMDRVELLVTVDNDKFSDELHKLAQGEDIPFSMACKVPYDRCDYCGHQAATRAQYCDHAKNNLTAITKEGRQICVHNPPGTFFDISKVARPADRIAWSLQKVAAAGTVVSSAEMAELLGIRAPRSVLEYSRQKVAGYLSEPIRISLDKRAQVVRKLAAIEKVIEGLAPANGVNIAELADGLDVDKTKDLPDAITSTLGKFNPEDVKKAFADAKICLPAKTFFKLLMGDRYNEVASDMDNVTSLLPGVFNRIHDTEDVDNFCSDCSQDIDDSRQPTMGLQGIVNSLVNDLSMNAEPVKRRITIVKIKGGSGTGFERPRVFTKISSDLGRAEYLAKEYAKYQISFCEKNDNSLVQGLTVLSNHIQ